MRQQAEWEWGWKWPWRSSLERLHQAQRGHGDGTVGLRQRLEDGEVVEARTGDVARMHMTPAGADGVELRMKAWVFVAAKRGEQRRCSERLAQGGGSAPAR
jgi:hypothetical protein